MFSSGKKIPREQKEPGLFDEAQSILFKEMLPYWAGFCKQYTQPEDVNKVKLPRKYCPFVQRSAVRAFKARGGYSLYIMTRLYGKFRRERVTLFRLQV